MMSICTPRNVARQFSALSGVVEIFFLRLTAAFEYAYEISSNHDVALTLVIGNKLKLTIFETNGSSNLFSTSLLKWIIQAYDHQLQYSWLLMTSITQNRDVCKTVEGSL